MPIHPTAIIHPDAQLPDDIEIGPYVCIEGRATIAAGCTLQASVVLSGTVTIGKNNLIGYGTIIGSWPQDLSFKPERRTDVVIGDGNTIREHCTIHRASVEGGTTRLGNDNFLMAGSHLGHDCHVGNHTIIANNSAFGGHVQIHDRVFVGGNSLYHQFVRVGRLAMTQGLTGLSKDLPPFTVGADINNVVGLNVIGLRRAGLGPEIRKEIKDAFNLVYKSGLNVTQALAQAREREWGPDARCFFEFIETTKRGICGLREAGGGHHLA